MMKLTTEQKRIILNKLIPGIIFFGVIIAVVINGQRYQYLLRKYPRYTVGNTIKTYWTFASGNQLFYEYFILGKRYTMSDRYNDKSKVPDGRYYVKFCVNSPEICEILQDKPVSDSVKYVPPNGWDEIPRCP